MSILKDFWRGSLASQNRRQRNEAIVPPPARTNSQHALLQPSSSLPPAPAWQVRLFQPVYIILVVCALVWFVKNSEMESLDRQKAPSIIELQRMNSGEYAFSAGLESLVRGFLGDPFGKTNEWFSKEAQLKGKLAAIQTAYEAAKGWRNLAFWIALITCCVVGLRKWLSRRRAAT